MVQLTGWFNSYCNKAISCSDPSIYQKFKASTWAGQGKKVLQENLRIGHYKLRGEPCYDFDLRTSTSIFEELAVIWRFPRQLELSTNNSNFNTPLYVTHSYFLAIRHALANCIAFMKSTKVLVRIGLGSCCALIMQHYGP